MDLQKAFNIELPKLLKASGGMTRNGVQNIESNGCEYYNFPLQYPLNSVFILWNRVQDQVEIRKRLIYTTHHTE